MTDTKRTRTPKYKNADDIINNCLIHGSDLCFVWPYGEESAAHPPPPVLSPTSHLTMKLGTNSVARVLFILCRYIPASKRLVKWCKTPSCVNPYHHTETTKMVQLRYDLAAKEGKEGRFFTDLIPSQEKLRHMLPSRDLIDELQPVELGILKLLQESAMQAGYDAKGLPASLRQDKVIPNASNSPPAFGEAGFKPVLVMKSYKPPLSADEEAARKAEIDKEADEWFNGGIFKEIEARKKRMLQKAVQDWELPAN
jgi:hypothetical protein